MTQPGRKADSLGLSEDVVHPRSLQCETTLGARTSCFPLEGRALPAQDFLKGFEGAPGSS